MSARIIESDMLDHAFKVDELIEYVDKSMPFQVDLTSEEKLEKEMELLKKEMELLNDSIGSLENEDIAYLKKVSEQKKKQRRLREQLKSLLRRKKFRLKEVDKLKTVNEALVKEPLSKNDIQLLEKCQRRLNLYEECTGIVFDYRSRDTAKGFVENRKTHQLQTFSTEDNITDSLWSAMSKVSTIPCSKHSKP